MRVARAPMGKIWTAITVAVLIIVLVVAALVQLWPSGDVENAAPVTNHGKPWRIAYYEGGPFYDYSDHLTALIDGLITLGWMEPFALPEPDTTDDTRILWQFLAENARSAYLTFVSDAYWSANWDGTLRAANRTTAIDRLARGGDIDLIIAMGTWAGLDLANDEHDVPTVVLSSSNAVEAGIVPSATDSGYGHVHAWTDPLQYLRQARLFHDIVGFRRLGVVYEATPDGRSYANLDELTQAAGERHFDLVLCAAPDIGVTQQAAKQGVARCLTYLAPRIDAMWISDGHRGFATDTMPELLAPLFAYHVPTWSVLGSEQVAHGVLLSISRRDLSGIGLWTARVIARIFHGAKPGTIDQVYVMPAAIEVNLETARRIHFNLPEGLLKAADMVYESIEGEEGWAQCG